MATLGALTYSQLVTAVSDYTQNTFDTTDMNTMIQQAEQRIYNTVQLANLRKSSSTALTINTQTMDAPTDFLSVYSFAVVDASGNYIYLLNKDANFMQEAYPNPTTTGTPKHYSLNGPAATVTRLQFIFGPTPSAALVTNLQYFYMPESIVTATTTWLGENFSSVLLYGTLCEAGTYMKSGMDDGMYKMYQERYVQAIALLKNLGDGKQRTDAYRSGQTRVEVS
jgi:hypothetical protein